LLCAACDRSGRSAWPDVVPGLTPDSIQQKYAETVASTEIAPGCVQFLGEEKRFRTAWVKTGKAQREQMFSALPLKADSERTSLLVWFVPKAGIKICCHSPRSLSVFDGCRIAEQCSWLRQNVAFGFSKTYLKSCGQW
jgi:hypothetical protein